MATTFNHFPAIADALPDVLSKVVRKTAFDCQKNIQGVIRANGQVDTGFMVNSVYVRTFDDSTYANALEKRATPSKNAKKITKLRMARAEQMYTSLLNEVEAPPDNHTAYVAVGALYGGYQNYGTRYLPARPFFEPGIEQTRPGFEGACQALESKLPH